MTPPSLSKNCLAILLMFVNFDYELNQGCRQKNFRRGEGHPKKQDLKIAPLNLPLIYQYHV